MELHNLPSSTLTSAKRLGRGHGSGRNKTSGRGTKGQKARRDIPLHFEGGALPLIKRMPFLRGKGRNKMIKDQTVVINVDTLNDLPAQSVVDLELLIKAKLVVDKEARRHGVKILGNGELKQPLVIKLPVSAGAKEKIEKAGGSVAV